MRAYTDKSLSPHPDAQDARAEGRHKQDSARKRRRIRTAMKKRARAALKRDLRDRLAD